MLQNDYVEKNSKYLNNNPTWHEEDSPWKAKQVVKMLSRNKLDINSIVEVGCGVGEILNQLYQILPNNIVFTGYDISIDALTIAKSKEKNRLNFKNENFLEISDRHDLLLMMDVFEHVEDYLGFLRKCSTKTKYAIFHIPLDISILGIIRNVPMNARKSVSHIHYFTKQTAIATLIDSGYEVLDYFYTAGMIELPNKSIMSKVAAIPRRILYSINKDFAVTLFGGFSLLVLAKKEIK
jgi:SAM-dependent methyltransferase